MIKSWRQLEPQEDYQTGHGTCKTKVKVKSKVIKVKVEAEVEVEVESVVLRTKSICCQQQHHQDSHHSLPPPLVLPPATLSTYTTTSTITIIMVAVDHDTTTRPATYIWQVLVSSLLLLSYRFFPMPLSLNYFHWLQWHGFAKKEAKLNIIYIYI